MQHKAKHPSRHVALNHSHGPTMPDNVFWTHASINHLHARQLSLALLGAKNMQRLCSHRFEPFPIATTLMNWLWPQQLTLEEFILALV